ncbi:hypothetical protein CEXT_529621 [Caerostris extrusa]|uniref:Uncharacterized protein n=1 Tax=Caerostris extrusa TaxID=172846 RepID=A0AAV4Y189_CAEEX|nr:hypothetical protein CEXT_529621 [Caerostris extrusa]
MYIIQIISSNADFVLRSFDGLDPLESRLYRPSRLGVQLRDLIIPLASAVDEHLNSRHQLCLEFVRLLTDYFRRIFNNNLPDEHV